MDGRAVARVRSPALERVDERQIGGLPFKLYRYRVPELRWTLTAALRLLGGQTLVQLLGGQFVIIEGEHSPGPPPGMVDLVVVQAVGDVDRLGALAVSTAVFTGAHTPA